MLASVIVKKEDSCNIDKVQFRVLCALGFIMPQTKRVPSLIDKNKLSIPWQTAASHTWELFDTYNGKVKPTYSLYQSYKSTIAL